MATETEKWMKIQWVLGRNRLPNLHWSERYVFLRRSTDITFYHAKQDNQAATLLKYLFENIYISMVSACRMTKKRTVWSLFSSEANAIVIRFLILATRIRKRCS